MSDISLSNKFHCLLVDLIKSIPEKDVGVFLSGGIDSQSILFACLEAGKNVTAYSFTLKDRTSKDFELAKYVSELFNVKFVPIFLPTDVLSLKKDLIRLNNEYLCTKKTEYECFWPFLYVYPKVSERIVLSGFGIGDWLPTGRKFAIHYGPDKVDEYREMCYLNINENQRIQHSIINLKFNVLLYSPFMGTEMYRLFYGTSYESCCKPKDKQIILDAFSKQFSKFSPRKPQNLQLGDSGISKLFEETLVNSDWNLHNYKSVTGIYNSINRGELPIGKKRLI